MVVKTMKIKCVVAYGCQENSTVEKKEAFLKFFRGRSSKIIAQKPDSYFNLMIIYRQGQTWCQEILAPKIKMENILNYF